MAVAAPVILLSERILPTDLETGNIKSHKQRKTPIFDIQEYWILILRCFRRAQMAAITIMSPPDKDQILPCFHPIPQEIHRNTSDTVQIYVEYSSALHALLTHRCSYRESSK